MSKSKGIWRYIKLRGDQMYFYKRYPSDVVGALGEFDRKSLGVKVGDVKSEQKAEAKAYQLLAKHEAEILAARGGTQLHDFSKVEKLSDLSAEDRFVIDQVLTAAKNGESTIELPIGLSKTALLMTYTNLQNGKYDNLLLGMFTDRHILMPDKGEVHDYAILAMREMFRSDLGIVTKAREIEEIESVDPDDKAAFEAAYFEKSDKKRPRPTIRISELWSKYETHFRESSKTKRLDEEVARHALYVESFIDWVGDIPFNYVTHSDVGEFFAALAKRPAKLTVEERGDKPRNIPGMTFKQIVESDHGRETISKKGAVEWYARLNRIFDWGYRKYRDQFDIRNPFEGMKRDVKGAKSIEKRPWEKSEIAALFAQKEFAVDAPRDSFFWSVLLALTHGNRLSEFHQRKIDQLRYDDSLDCHYIQIVEGKNRTSNRRVPISDVVIKAGFMDWVAANKAAGHEWLFPSEDHEDPDSREFSRNFGKWLLRRGLYDPERTFHNFRNTWLTQAYRTEYPVGMGDVELIARRISGHADKDVHQGYIGEQWEQMKVMVDTVRIKGLPYERFGVNDA